MSIKWKCPNCGALHEQNEALAIMLSKGFMPVEVEEKKEKVRMEDAERRVTALEDRIPRRPQRPVEKRPVEEFAEDEEEEEDLTLK